MKIKKKYILIILIPIIFIFLYLENNLITTTNINVKSARIPKSFNGYRIVHISDLHSKLFGSNQKTLVSKIKNAKPDLIVITGDLIDAHNNDEENSLKLIDGIKDICPVYYVTGNHEYWSGKVQSLETSLKNRGVKVLKNSSEKIERTGESIVIGGANYEELNMDVAKDFNNNNKTVLDQLNKLYDKNSESEYKILLSHRPELFPLYTKANIDLAFCGHAHGGQVRLPFIGGLVAPNQGFFPKYTSGKYSECSSNMIVSRGLGNSIIPQRLFNRPEIVVVTLMNN